MMRPVLRLNLPSFSGKTQILHMMCIAFFIRFIARLKPCAVIAKVREDRTVEMIEVKGETVDANSFAPTSL